MSGCVPIKLYFQKQQLLDLANGGAVYCLPVRQWMEHTHLEVKGEGLKLYLNQSCCVKADNYFVVLSLYLPCRVISI